MTEAKEKSLSSSVGDAAAEVDIYRDTPVRLLGYANEVGEAFRVWIAPFWVRATYGVSSAYVLADTYDKGSKAAQRPLASEADRRTHVLHVAADTLLWQALASVILPGLTINRLCAATFWALERGTRLPLPARKRLTTAAGLAVIPLIVRPIDQLVDLTLDHTFRKVAHIAPDEKQHESPSH